MAQDPRLKPSPLSDSGASAAIAGRVATLDWPRLHGDLDCRGYCVIPGLLPEDICAELIANYEEPSLYRSRIIMARHHFGLGEYKYYDYPLPPAVEALRRTLYRRLAPLANAWARAQGSGARYPAEHEPYLRRCRAAGQTRPTPLILRYEKDGYNCLHQDLYGELHFPLQVAILLSRPGEDFKGGELVLTEQRPRMQSRVEVVDLSRGDGAVFAVNERPARGTRGYYRVRMRHGVSRLTAGERFVLGIIFHDAA